MDRENAKAYIQSKLKECMDDYMARSQKAGRNMYECPVCGSGTGPNGTGAVMFYPSTNKWYCHICKAGGDIFDWIGAKENISDYNQQFDKACDILGVDVDDPQTMRAINAFKPQAKQEQKKVMDFTNFYLQAHANIDKTDYWKQRGLSRETVDRFNIGYVANWKPPKYENNPNMPATPRLIIPTSESSYLARDTRAEVNKGGSKLKAGAVNCFNKEVLKNATQPIFVVEGEIDALSIIEVGGEAIGLGSTSETGAFLKLVKQEPPKKPLIIAMDNDNGGREATQKLEAGLQELRLPYVVNISIYGECKDANEALVKDRKAFKEAVYLAVAQVETEATEAQAEKVADYVASKSALNCVARLLDNVKSGVVNNYVPTGFKSIDRILDGGLYAGLYAVGAISSLGKTTFCLQVADNIAKGGNDVLIFSLEMASEELIAKSLSRHTFELATVLYGDRKYAKTTRGILTSKLYASYSNKDKEVIAQAVAQYEKYAGHIFIHEGVGNIGVNQIKKIVKDHITFTGNKPVVLIDYMQILAAPSADYRGSDKQKTDENVLELKRLSRDEGIPIVGISSFNRDNYATPVNMASLKESGALEYGSDVVIGLQYEGMDYQEGEADKAREKRIRTLHKDCKADKKAGKPIKVQVKILKNRNGVQDDAMLEFLSKFNYFTDVEQETPQAWKEVGAVVALPTL